MNNESNNMKNEVYPGLEALEKFLLAGLPDKCTLHITVVHDRKWWCVSLDTPTKSNGHKPENIRRKVEDKLQLLWPKEICHPQSEHSMSETHSSYWLPAQERESKDFEDFHPAHKRRKN